MSSYASVSFEVQPVRRKKADKGIWRHKKIFESRESREANLGTLGVLSTAREASSTPEIDVICDTGFTSTSLNVVFVYPLKEGSGEGRLVVLMHRRSWLGWFAHDHFQSFEPYAVPRANRSKKHKRAIRIDTLLD